MDGKTWLAPLTGILFIIVLVVGFVVSGEPPDPTDEPAQEIVDFYVDNKSSVMVGSILQAIAGALFIFFGGYLFRTLRAAGAEASAIVTLAGTVAFALGMALDGTINFTLAETADDIGPDAVQALSALWNNDFLPFSMGLLVFLMGFGASIVRHGVLPKWIGWVAIVASLTAISPAFFVAGVGAVVLIVGTSVVFARRDRSAQAA
jgi:hypothetical protein